MPVQAQPTGRLKRQQRGFGGRYTNPPAPDGPAFHVGATQRASAPVLPALPSASAHSTAMPLESIHLIPFGARSVPEKKMLQYEKTIQRRPSDTIQVPTVSMQKARWLPWSPAFSARGTSQGPKGGEPSKARSPQPADL